LFAEFGALAAAPDRAVDYPSSGARFLGATFDPVGIYRQRAVLSWMATNGLAANHAKKVGSLSRDMVNIDQTTLHAAR
jgi:hypothetical protein